MADAGELAIEILDLPFLSQELGQNSELLHLEDPLDQYSDLAPDFLTWALAELHLLMHLICSYDFEQLHLALVRLTGRVHEGCALCQ